MGVLTDIHRRCFRAVLADDRGFRAGLQPDHLRVGEHCGDGEPEALFGDRWSDAGMDAIQAAGRLYAIDMSIFESFAPATVDNLVRFTPGTITLLEQDAATKKLTPLAIKGVAQGTQWCIPPSAPPRAHGSTRYRRRKHR